VVALGRVQLGADGGNCTSVMLAVGHAIARDRAEREQGAASTRAGCHLFTPRAYCHLVYNTGATVGVDGCCATGGPLLLGGDVSQ
jgi:hypothetical protein